MLASHRVRTGAELRVERERLVEAVLRVQVERLEQLDGAHLLRALVGGDVLARVLHARSGRTSHNSHSHIRSCTLS